MGQLYRCWWRIYREIIFFFSCEYHVLRFISVCNQYTDPPFYNLNQVCIVRLDVAVSITRIIHLSKMLP
jgi:hypothetical protein